MKRTIKETLITMKCFDKKKDEVREICFGILETNQRKIDKYIKEKVNNENLVLIEVTAQNVSKKTYEMDNETFFKHAKLVR